MRKPYCTNKTLTDCRECSLMSYNRDCRNNPIDKSGPLVSADSMRVNVHVDARIPRTLQREIRELVMARQEAAGRFVSQNSVIVEILEAGLRVVKGGGE